MNTQKITPSEKRLRGPGCLRGRKARQTSSLISRDGGSKGRRVDEGGRQVFTIDDDHRCAVKTTSRRGDRHRRGADRRVVWNNLLQPGVALAEERTGHGHPENQET